MKRATRPRTLSPSKSSTGGESGTPESRQSEPRTLRSAARWVGLTLLVGIACCSQGLRPTEGLKATSTTDRVRVFLIARKDLSDDDGKGPCDAKPEPVEVTLPSEAPALEGSLEGLLSLGRDPYDTRSGLYNALHASPLMIEKIERRGPEALIRLKGYLELGSACDGKRALAQLTETVLQFPDVQRVQFYLEEKPLRDVLPR
jgi:sporulation and spore germination protein